MNPATARRSGAAIALLGALHGVIFALASPRLAIAWGREGHEITCEIAWLELEPKARAAVAAIVDADPEIASFRDACTWADRDGEVQSLRRSEHYVNVPRRWTSVWSERCPMAKSCLFTGIRDDLHLLSSAHAEPARKQVALKFLTHWIGDIHQPLHVSFEDDRGGNEVAVEPSLGCRPNLHAVWDTCIPRDLMQDAGVQKTQQFALMLQREVTAAEREAWTKDLSPPAWASESLAIVRRPSVLYCTLDDRGRCRHSEGSLELEKRRDGRERAGAGTGDSAPKVLELTGAYEDEHGPVVRERLKQAGVRLGAMLNTLWR